jgi:hypothetical protein
MDRQGWLAGFLLGCMNSGVCIVGLLDCHHVIAQFFLPMIDVVFAVETQV